jgi:hypothetical protein
MNKVEKKTVQEEQIENTAVVADGDVENSEPKQEGTKAIAPNVDKPLEQYRYGDTVISCALCGTDTPITHPEFVNVNIGLNLPPLYTTNHHCLGLACGNPECKSRLTLRMIKSVNPPAYEYNYERAYNVPLDLELTWVAGDSAESYEVFVQEWNNSGKDQEEPKFESKGVVTEAKINLKLVEGYSYNYRVDTRYSEDKVVTGPDVFISTKDAPVTAKEVSEDAIAITQDNATDTAE